MRKAFNNGQRLWFASRLLRGEDVNDLAEEAGVTRCAIYQWRNKYFDKSEIRTEWINLKPEPVTFDITKNVASKVQKAIAPFSHRYGYAQYEHFKAGAEFARDIICAALRAARGEEDEGE